MATKPDRPRPKVVPTESHEELVRRPVPDETVPEESKPSEAVVTPKRGVVTTPPGVEPPGWFVAHHRADLDDLASRARASGKIETTAIRTAIIGSGNMGSVVICSDGHRLWSEHNDLIESWWGHLKR